MTPKFSAYDHHTKRIYPVLDLRFINGEVESIAIEVRKGVGVYREKSDGELPVLLMFTGFKDKVDVPIYGGDVVDVDGWDPLRYQVKWFDGGFGLADAKGYWMANLDMIEDSSGVHARVIGNIYTHTDLLPESKVCQFRLG